MDRDDCHQVGGEESFQHIEHGGLDICPAILVLHRQVKGGHNDAHTKQHPAEEENRWTADSIQDKSKISAPMSPISGEHIGDGIIEGVEEPLHQVVPNGAHNGVANTLEHPAYGGGDTAD